jgi:hypothetical protein
MFKVNKNKFLKFLERTMPIPTITEAIFNFKENGIEVISANLQTRDLVISSFISKDNFIEYTNIGEVGIRALGTVIKMISSLDSETILFDKTEQFLIFYNEVKSKEIKCILPDLNTMGRIPKLKEFDFNIDFILSEFSIFSKLKKNYLSVGSEKFILTFKNNTITVLTENNTGDFSIKEEIVIDGQCFPEIKTIVGKNLMSVVDKVNEDSTVKLSIGSNLPIKIEINDFMSSTYLLATLG